MREIKFRGKSIKSGKWYYGHFSEDNIRGQHKKVSVIIENSWSVEGCGGKDYFIENDKIDSVVVDPETVGQYTGLKDKGGKEIYEDDICQDNIGDVVQVVWSEKHQWGCKIIKGCILSQRLVFPLWQWDKCEENGNRQLTIIGNIYENPELLEVSKN